MESRGVCRVDNDTSGIGSDEYHLSLLSLLAGGLVRSLRVSWRNDSCC